MGIFRRFRTVFAFTALVAVTACTSWQPYQIDPGQARLPATVRLILESGEEVSLREPFVVGDSVIAGLTSSEGAFRTIAVKDVRQFETRRFSGARTWALAIGVTTAALLIYSTQAWVLVCYLGNDGCND